MILTHVIIYQTHIIGLTRFFDFFWTEILRFEGKKKKCWILPHSRNSFKKIYMNQPLD